MWKTIIFVLTLQWYFAVGASVEIASLRFVHVLWRHGDRNPANTFPTDKENAEWTWPQGYGELTQIGMKQQYLLGKYLRERYVDSGFLSTDYNSTEIYVRSTSFNRTIMSALVNLAGMYPVQQGSSSWLTDMPWQPIPVHSIERIDDPMLWMDKPCPIVNKIYKDDIWPSKEVRQIEEENADFLEMLKEKTGMKRMILNDLWDVFDPLNCERVHSDSHKWPSWVNESIFDQIAHLHDLSTLFYYNDPRVQRLRGGLLFGEIASRMEQKARRSPNLLPSGLKYYAYSIHDLTLMALMINMDVYNGHNPPYASALIFELHEKQPGKYVVELWFLNQTDTFDNPVRLSITDCDTADEECDLNTFVKLAKEHTPDDWYAECGLSNNGTAVTHGASIKTTAVVFGILASIFFLMLLATAVLHCKRKK